MFYLFLQMEYLLEIDTWLFNIINSGMANPATDSLMPILTDKNTWLPIYIVLFIWLIWKGGTRGRITFILLIIGIIASDQISSSIMKPFFDRIRPCHELSDINLLVSCGAGKSFPSSHAANSFTAATILFWYNKSWGKYAFILAGLIAFSRVFVGVHYPSDILTGAVLGIFISFILIFLLKMINKKMKILD
jgi:undecaprenyl-diphosphatase